MTVRDELAAINAGFERALLEQDAERVAAYYAEDARLLLHGSPIIGVERRSRRSCASGSRPARMRSGSRPVK